MASLLDRDTDIREIMKILEYNHEQNCPVTHTSSEDIQTLIMYLEENNRIETSGYTIHSHRKISGHILTFFRKIIHGEVRRYADPLIHQQNYVNQLILEIITSLMSENEELKREINRIKKLTN